MDIWNFQSRLTRRLMVWSVLSVAVSALTIFSADPFLRGLAIQFFVWGAIDGGIAIFGAQASIKRQAKIGISGGESDEAKETRWLSRILWINTGMDVLYVLGGIWVLQTWGAGDIPWRGHGWGIIIQGSFLFFFDFYHAWVLRGS